MNFNKFEKYAKPVLRIMMAFVFLYFGYQQFTNPASWTGFVPDYVLIFGMTAERLVFMNSLLELGLGVLLLIGLYTRFAAFILSLHLFGIAFSLGFNDLGMRDFGLAVATLVVFMNGSDDFCLDRKFRKVG